MSRIDNSVLGKKQEKGTAFWNGIGEQYLEKQLPNSQVEGYARAMKKELTGARLSNASGALTVGI